MLLRLILLLCITLCAYGLDNGLGLTPQMGWNSWNHFGCNINQQLIKRTADLLVKTGLADKGYKYVNLDDCWQIARNQTTKQIVEDAEKFPSGMRNLSQYVHSKGLKFGLYSDAGEKTCQGRPGSLNYQSIDAKTYAAWQVDYLKYDNCYNLNISGKLRYYSMYKALNESGRQIFYSMCNWGQERSWEWAGPLANSWRTTGDIANNWRSFTNILDQQVGLEVYAGRGGWNDPDMLQVGNAGMSYNEYYAHFAFWCVLKAPLIIGCDLQGISVETLTILGNEELIAINQDPLGIQASRIRRTVKQDGTTEVWGGDLSGDRYVVVFFNRGDVEDKVKVDIRKQLRKQFDNYSTRDVIKHEDLGAIQTNPVITVTVQTHSVVVYVLKLYKAKEVGQLGMGQKGSEAHLRVDGEGEEEKEEVKEQEQEQVKEEAQEKAKEEKPVKNNKHRNHRTRTQKKQQNKPQEKVLKNNEEQPVPKVSQIANQ